MAGSTRRWTTWAAQTTTSSATTRPLALAGACAVAFLTLAVLVALHLTSASDLGWTLAFQSVASYPLDLVANAHTVLGQVLVTLPLSAVLAVFVWRRYGGWAWLAPSLILATVAIELAFKVLLPHPSPPAEFVRAFHNVLGVRGPPASFPSGHVARVTFVTVVLVAMYPRRWSAIAAVAFVAASVFLRVYIGDHWLADAIAGAALGGAFGAIAAAWMLATGRRRSGSGSAARSGL